MNADTAQPPATPRPSHALQRRRRRIGRIRRATATVAATAFVALWGGLFIQLRSGNDPALGATVTSTAGAANGSTGTTGTTGTTPSDSTGASDSSASADATLAPATTSQS